VKGRGDDGAYHDPKVELFPEARPEGAGSDLEVYHARIELPEKTDVPCECERGGKIIFLGTEFKPGERVPTGNDLARKILEGKVYEQVMRFLIYEIGPGEKLAPGEQKFTFADGKSYRRWREGDRLDPGKLKILPETRLFRKLKQGDRVQKGDLLALVNPALAFDDLMVKSAKLDAAEAEMYASVKTRDEAERRYYRDRNLRATSPGTVSEDELRASELAWQRYSEEVKAKTAAISSAQQELNEAITVLKLHEVRALTDGTVRQLYKNTGDAAKYLDGVLQLQNVDRPRVEGMVGLQYSLRLQDRMAELKKADKDEAVRVTLEVTRPVEPRVKLLGHNREVNAVAASPGPHPFVVSGDEEGRLIGWSPEGQGRPLWNVRNGSAVRSLACSLDPLADTVPQMLRGLLDAAGDRPLDDQVLVGMADGTAYLMSLDKIRQSLAQGGKANLPEFRWLEGMDKGRPIRVHQGPVNCAAFSPDGRLVATGGEDYSIRVWDAHTGKLIVPIREAHRGPVTSLEFASNNELVSAGRDGRLILWTLNGDQTPSADSLADYRSNTVAHLGLDRARRRSLLDQGSDLRVFSIDHRETVRNGVLHNPSAAGGFATMALFSPDGQTILTNSPADNKLQLWRAPLGGKRPYEQRLLSGTTPTCGAFGQKASDNFAVTGSRDGRVLIWDLPSAEEEPLEAALTYVEISADNTQHQVHIRAEPLRNPAPSWVVPGSTATMIIHPDEVVRTVEGTP
jgi:WD40 repeat protein